MHLLQRRKRKASATAISLQAVASESYNAPTFTTTYDGGASIPGGGETIDQLDFQADIVDAGQANDGRSIVFRLTSLTDTNPTVVSDTGGTPASRFTVGTDATVTGTGGNVIIVSEAANDFVVSSAGTVTLTLTARDTSTTTDTVVV